MRCREIVKIETLFLVVLIHFLEPILFFFLFPRVYCLFIHNVSEIARILLFLLILLLCSGQTFEDFFLSALSFFCFKLLFFQSNSLCLFFTSFLFQFLFNPALLHLSFLAHRKLAFINWSFFCFHGFKFCHTSWFWAFPLHRILILNLLFNLFLLFFFFFCFFFCYLYLFDFLRLRFSLLSRFIFFRRFWRLLLLLWGLRLLLWLLLFSWSLLLFVFLWL